MNLIITFLSCISIVLILSSLKIVDENEVCIIERFGKFYKTIHSGIAFIIPFIDKVKCVMNAKTVKKYSIINSTFCDKNMLICEYNIFFNIIDYEKAAYKIEDIKNIGAYIIELSNKSFIEMVKGIDSSKFEYLEDKINRDLRLSINKEICYTGLEIEKFEITNKRKIEVI